MKRPKEEYIVTLSAQDSEPVTISGDLFSQVANSFKQPTKPCRNCGSGEWAKAKHGYWLCSKCGQLSAWRRGHELRKVKKEIE